MPSPDPTSSTTYRARWVWAGGRWIEGGRVTIAGQRIVAVGDRPVAGEIDRGEELLLPGLVNAHTHLEFSALREPLPVAGSFASWIRNVVQWRRTQSDEAITAAIQQGAQESVQAGVTTLGEIATRAGLTPEPPRTVAFREALGLLPAAVQPQLEMARAHLTQYQAAGRTPGLSPHAPYSLSRELLFGVIELAQRSAGPLAIHLAETHEELELLHAGTGPLAELFTEWGLWSPGQRAAVQSPAEVIQAMLPNPRVLIIHGNYLTADEMDRMAGRDNFSVVYCPRTHTYFQHEPYPLAAILKRGIRVALGTDSRASNPDLDLLAEVRHAHHRHPSVSPEQWLKMATRQGAEALGLGALTGSIREGLAADLCRISIPPSVSDPWEVILGTTAPARPLPVD